jgi:hypothetical protein
MNRISMLAAMLAVGLGVAGNAAAQTVGYNVRTGDVWVDTRLDEINDYGRRYRDTFIGEMTDHYGAPRPLIVELLDQRRWSPGDVYYACAIAQVLRLPCIDVVREYDRDPGQGWGNLAKRLGIKPGSPQFHALKRGAVGTYDRWGHPIAVDRNVRVDWSQHGPDKGNAGRPKENAGNAGSKGKGQGGRGGDNGGSQGKEKGNGKGRDRS